ncbi:MAG: twin-arginine translocase subunit TatC [Deltaproteobacteria bacterium]
MSDLEMPLTEHLEELRWRIVKAVAAVAIGFAVSYLFADRLFDVLTAPIKTVGEGTDLSMIGTGVAEAFFTKLKVSFIAGIFLASPVLFYQVWTFVAPGLHGNEKMYVIPFVVFGTFFFFAGAVFCYFTVFYIGYRFFLEQYQTIGIQPALRISEYLSFSSRLLLAFGITFELPVIAFFFARIGMIDHNTLIRPWRYALIFIMILAAILTPGPDIASQMLLATPLVLLYGVSIIVAFFFHRRPTESATGTE